MTTPRCVELFSLRRRSAALAAALVVTALFLSGVPTLAQPTFSQSEAIVLSPGDTVVYSADDVFDNAGTNSKFSSATFSTLDYYKNAQVVPYLGSLAVSVKTDAQLNALSSPPDSPFTVTVDVTMTNDEGQTASGTLSFKTTYVKNSMNPVLDALQTIGQALQPILQPTAIENSTLSAPPGVRVSVGADSLFNNPGTNARITTFSFSTVEYYQGVGDDNGELWVQAKTDAELNALPSPPDSPITVTADVTMTNDEGQAATNTLEITTRYNKQDATTQPIANPEPAAAATPPTQKTDPYGNWKVVNAPAGLLVTWSPQSEFDNPGTNPVFTSAEFSTTAYYTEAGISSNRIRMVIRAKTSSELYYMSPKPSNPIEVTLRMTITNDEGLTGTATKTVRTVWNTSPPTPVFTQTASIDAPVGTFLTIYPGQVFDHAGTNPYFGSVEFSTMAYCSFCAPSGGGGSDAIYVTAKSAGHSFTVTVTLTNDEGTTGTGTVTFETSE